ncbi:unnamed protein product [Urochloa humidicola]
MAASAELEGGVARRFATSLLWSSIHSSMSSGSRPRPTRGAAPFSAMAQLLPQRQHGSFSSGVAAVSTANSRSLSPPASSPGTGRVGPEPNLLCGRRGACVAVGCFFFGVCGCEPPVTWGGEGIKLAGELMN